MKKKFKILIQILVLSVIVSCKPDIEKKVIVAYPNGNPATIQYYIKNASNVRELIKEERLYINGKLKMSGEYKNGEKHGKWIYWYENGQKWSEGYYKNGISEGKTKVWYHNGFLNYEGYYKNGKPDGKWWFYDNSGNKLKLVIFKNGKKVKEKTYY